MKNMIKKFRSEKEQNRQEQEFISKKNFIVVIEPVQLIL